MSSSAGPIQQLSGLFNGAGVSNTLMPADPGGSGGGPLMGSNQYSSYPATATSGAGSVPTAPGLPTGGTSSNSGLNGPNTGAYYATGGDTPGTNSIHLSPTMDPSLTQAYYNMLFGQLGQGLPGFNQSTVLPSSGQATNPGDVNAPLNNVYQQLENFLTGGPSTLPGATSATTMAQTGNPVNQTPAWQAMLASEQQNTAQNANNLREQFASGGDLNSSPFGNAMQQFYNQNTMNQNAQLTQATTAEGDAAASRALTAQQGELGLAGSVGSSLQTIDQNAINQMLKEFYIGLPQNNPLLQNEAQAANMQPNVAGQTPTTAQNVSSFISSLGSLF